MSRREPRRLVKIPHACTECKRRKIRCDGGQPCRRCTTRGVAQSCFYTRHRQRIHPSKQKLEKLSRTLEEYRTVVDRLFPDHDVSQLLSIPREDLLDILNIPRYNQTTATSPTTTCNSNNNNWLPSPPPNPIPFHAELRASPFPQPTGFDAMNVPQMMQFAADAGCLSWEESGKQVPVLFSTF
ncbi:putative transcriptional regulatory protein-like protein [Hapsidospora chrysogenum ATCC 11550]|uniref:Putative transcriptional regulatory protein-like protein n=1 Tax=Hapsidospora chrysogenum (strain ATCC 11550 / CBS 779.69 / DSM 880 / IAM 14645 / JCM 23072 / IMI 49137) TaxID=857340 RepID=A0A086TAY9_HAPC1|nr:putative transcriptional regulatory protein-like protein [Hapsidospora chrysogenum ATCC 11550]